MKTIICKPLENRQPLVMANGTHVIGGREIGMPVPFEENEIVFYFRSASGRIMSIDAGRLFCERDGASLLALRGGSATSVPVAVMWSGSAAEEPVMIIVPECSPDETVEYATLTEEQQNLPLLSLVGTLSEAAGRRLTNMNAKARLLHRIVPQDAVAALEKQVDMLTRLVAPLVELIPADSRPDWTQDFLDAVSRTTALDSGRTPAALIEDFAAQKQIIREAQADYFAERVDV